MNKFIKVFLVCVCIFSVFLCASCSDLKLTPEMEKSIDLYIDAVTSAESAKSGKINIVSVIDDAAFEFKTTETVIDFKYEVNAGKLIFDRLDTLDGEKTAEYKCDGEKIEAFDFEKDEWSDATEENKDYLDIKTNPITSLSLFRVDSNKKVDTSHLSDISRQTEGEYTVITFTLKDESVSTVLSYNKADGVVRESAGHTRSYYLDSDGELVRIQIVAVQDIISNGETNKYTTEITVSIER